MPKYLLYILLMCFSCVSGREMVNKEIVGSWQLISIECETTDSIPGLNDLREYQKEYIGNFRLKINNESQYSFSFTETNFTDFNEKTHELIIKKALVEEF